MTWNEFLDACRAWEKARDEATTAAYMAFRRKAGNDYHVLEYEDLARRARHDAGVQYELTVPRPEWNEEIGNGNNCVLRYVDEAAAAGARCAA